MRVCIEAHQCIKMHVHHCITMHHCRRSRKRDPSPRPDPLDGLWGGRGGPSLSGGATGKHIAPCRKAPTSGIVSRQTNRNAKRKAPAHAELRHHSPIDSARPLAPCSCHKLEHAPMTWVERMMSTAAAQADPETARRLVEQYLKGNPHANHDQVHTPRPATLRDGG